MGHSILRIAYHLLKDPDALDNDLGPDYFDNQNKQRLAAQLLRPLGKLGYVVTFEPAA